MFYFERVFYSIRKLQRNLFLSKTGPSVHRCSLKINRFPFHLDVSNITHPGFGSLLWDGCCEGVSDVLKPTCEWHHCECVILGSLLFLFSCLAFYFSVSLYRVSFLLCFCFCPDLVQILFKALVSLCHAGVASQ